MWFTGPASWPGGAFQQAPFGPCVAESSSVPCQAPPGTRRSGDSQRAAKGRSKAAVTREEAFICFLPRV